MSRRDAPPAEPTGPTPVDPERDEPSDDEQQPDEKPKPSPEGEKPKAPKPDEQPDEDQAEDDDGGDDADDADKPDRAKDDDGKVNYKAKYEETEQKRRDFESRAATAENTARQWQEHATKVDSFWRRIVQRDAPDLYEKVTNEERAAATKGGERAASRGSSYEVIAKVYREGDSGFADFLTTLVEDSDVRITPQSLQRHRQTFDKIAAGRSSANGNGAAATTAPPAPPRRGDPSRPPKVPASGRVPVGGDDDEEPWKPGQPFDVRGNISRGLKKSAAQRRGR